MGIINYITKLFKSENSNGIITHNKTEQQNQSNENFKSKLSDLILSEGHENNSMYELPINKTVIFLEELIYKYNKDVNFIIQKLTKNSQDLTFSEFNKLVNREEMEEEIKPTLIKYRNELNQIADQIFLISWMKSKFLLSKENKEDKKFDNIHEDIFFDLIEQFVSLIATKWDKNEIKKYLIITSDKYEIELDKLNS